MEVFCNNRRNRWSCCIYTTFLFSVSVSVMILWMYPSLIYEIQRGAYMKNVSFQYFNVKNVLLMKIQDTLSLQFQIQIYNNANQPISFPRQMECIVEYLQCKDMPECSKLFTDYQRILPFNEYGSIYWADGCQGVIFGPSVNYNQPVPYYIIVLVVILWNIFLFGKIQCMIAKGTIYNWVCHEQEDTTGTNVITTISGVQPHTHINRPVIITSPLWQDILEKQIYNRLVAKGLSERRIPSSENQECMITMEPIHLDYYHCPVCEKNFDTKSFIKWAIDNKHCPHCRQIIHPNETEMSISSFVIPLEQRGMSV